MFDIFKKIFGTAQGRLLKKYGRLVKKINKLELELQSLSDAELKAKTAEFKERFAKGETLDDLLVEAYAVVKNTCRRLVGTEVHVSGYDQKWDMVPFDVQLVGGIALHYGSIAEMQTGEGKTLTSTLPLYLNALSGKPVHLVTVNDYLAKRDCQWIGEIFRWHGLRTESLTNETPPNERKDLYKADIVYGTASEFGFDYLRDNSMAQAADEQCQRGHFFSIVDEVDSILIDEARTPLIISGPTNDSKQMYEVLQKPVEAVVKVQRDLCNKYATDARKILESLGRLEESEEKKKLTKPQQKEFEEAFKSLWLVNKGNPHNKTLRRIKENPDLRAELDKLDVYYHGEPNKEERLAALAKLYLIVDEKASEYELTDKGIQYWVESIEGTTENDFLMLDLGHEYALIDEQNLDEQEAMQRKVALREEDAKRKERSHNLRQMLRAHLLMEKDVDYIVEQDKIVIIDENTGRPQPGRRFSDGLHQAIEAKENVKIQGETQTYATITLQNYFRLYDKLAGMTGTAMTEANEFKEIYKLEVIAIPTHRKCVRTDFDDEIYMTEREKYNALVADIQKIHAEGRPILIGTESVEVSEKIARILRGSKLPHTILNAKNHEHEAQIIADAGKEGAITVATNMAGRGTDIKLKEGVADKGGLHVIGTTRHQSRRIDRQLRGRCARQGDPGTSKFYVSFEDTLMRLFTSPRITMFLQRFRPPEGEPISAKVLNKSIETAQKRVEGRNYEMRKRTLEYDDVMNKQREEIYSFRNEVLRAEDAIPLAEEILEHVCMEMAGQFFSSRTTPGGWDPEGYRQWLVTHFPVTFETSDFDSDYLSIEELEKVAIDKVLESFRHKFERQKEGIRKMHKAMNPDNSSEINADGVLADVSRSLLIRNIDSRWQEHLLHIDHLRTEVSVRSIGQKDPLLEFKHEAFALFDTLSREMKVEIAHALFKFEMVMPEPELPATQTIDLPRSKPKATKPKKEKKPASPMIDLSMMDLDGE
ncbi:MAG: preprotein translocase subunit SecA [Simkaniaceae bacterium]|nr:preprotein translocase subunit SecA [Candidatus Sacchlamyda saccharinae]